jgi:ComF family protein
MFAALARAVLDFSLPRTCVACQAPRHEASPDVASDPRRLVCDTCLEAIVPLPEPRCSRCGHPSRARRPCPLCPHLPPTLQWGRSAVWATDAGPQRLLHAFKYDGWPSLDEVLAEWMAPLGPPPVPACRRGVLVPVPMAASKRRERGYCQTSRLAEALGRRWHWPVRSDLLAKTRATEAQAQLHAAERQTNIQGCFAPRPDARFRRWHVLLVDDVVTTGATLAECANALAGAGADSISFITFGRARAPGER